MQDKCNHNVEIGEIVSYRVWSARIFKFPRLVSLYASYIWEPHINKAELITYNTTMNMTLKWPETAGFYSFKTFDLAEKLFLQQSLLFYNPILLGSIYNWGEVIEHENGYRSTHAAIKSLDYINLHPLNFVDSFETIDILRKIYKINA